MYFKSCLKNSKMVRAIIALETRYYRHMCRSRQKRNALRNSLYETHVPLSLARSFECVSSKMEIWPSSVVVVGFRAGAASQLNLPETQYLLSVRKTHGLVGSSGAHCERSCTPRVREREMHNSQFARRQARYYFPRIRYTGCFAMECLQEYYC